MSKFRTTHILGKSLSMFLAFVMLLGCVVVAGPVALADDPVTVLTVSLVEADTAVDLDPDDIRATIVGGVGTLHYALALTEGTPPVEGAKITDLPPTPIGPPVLLDDISGAVAGQWLRVYDVDGGGDIIGYGAVIVAWDNIGDAVAPTGSEIPVTAVAIDDSDATFEALVTPVDALVLYQWSVEDAILGSVTLGTGATLANAPLDRDVTLTVLGYDTHTGTASDIRPADTGSGGDYTITVTNGTATVSGVTVTEADAGDQVTVTAAAASPGQEFDKWVATGITLSAAEEETNPLTFTMPAGNVSFNATYKSTGGPDFNVPGGTPGVGSLEYPAKTPVRTFYIDQNAAAGGDGTSPATAFNTLAPIGAGTVQPGDHFLIAAGNIFNNVRISTGANGTADNPIVVGMYGIGAKPVLNGINDSGGGTGTVISIGHAYWEFRELFISFWNGTTFDGITSGTRRAFSGSGGNAASPRHHLYIIDCDIFHIDSDKQDTAGVGVATSGIWKNVRIIGNTMIGVSRTALRIAGGSGNTGMTWVADLSHEVAQEEAKTSDVIIKNNFFDRVGGDILINDYTYGLIYEYNTAFRACHDLPGEARPGTSTNLYSAGVWGWHSVNAIYQYNEIAYIRDGGIGDRSAFDFDSNCSGYTIYQYNYTHHNSGGQMLFCEAGRTAGGNAGTGYVQDTRVIRFNVSAFESLSTGPSGTSELTFVYNNIYYKATPGRTTRQMNQGWDTNIYDGRAFTDPWDDWKVSPLGHAQNATFGNYIFNNIFYECELITLEDATTSAHSNNTWKVFALSHIFRNNLLYNTPVFFISDMDTELTAAQLTGTDHLIVNNNIIANPKFLGDIDPRDADGFGALNALRLAHDSPAIDAGISITDMLQVIQTDITRANAAAPASVTWPLDYAHINQRVFDPAVAGSVAPTVDFFGSPLSGGSASFIGIGAASASAQPIILDLEIEPRRLVMEHDEDFSDYPSDVTVTVTGENLAGTEVLAIFGKEVPFTSGTPITVDLSDIGLDLTIGARNYATVKAANGSLMKINWMGLFQMEEEIVIPPDPGLFLSHGDDVAAGSISIKSAVDVGDVGDDLYYVLAMSEGTAPTIGQPIAGIPTAMPVTIGQPLENVPHEDFWLRVYAVDGGLITGYDATQVRWVNIGTRIHWENPGVVTGNDQFIPVGEDSWANYRLEFDMVRVSGVGPVNFYFHHLGTGVGEGSTWWMIPIRFQTTYDWVDLNFRDANGMVSTTGAPDSSGWWTDFMGDRDVDIHYQIIAAANNQGTPTSQEWVPANNLSGIQLRGEPTDAPRLPDGSRAYTSLEFHKGNYYQRPQGGRTINANGKLGYSVATGTVADIRNLSVHEDQTDTYSSRILITDAGLRIEKLASGDILYGIAPIGAPVMYEWSYMDTDLGSVVLGYGWELDLSAFVGVDAEDVILTVAGIDTHRGTASVNTITIVNDIPDDPALTQAKFLLNQAIENAEALTETDYMADSWATLAPAIATAKGVLAGSDVISELDDARTALGLVVDALAQTYAITFSDGGRAVPASLRVLPSGVLADWPVPQRPGYAFAGWFDAASGGVKYEDGFVFTGNTTVYAEWTAVTVTGGGLIGAVLAERPGRMPTGNNDISSLPLDYILEFEMSLSANGGPTLTFRRGTGNTANNQLVINRVDVTPTRFSNNTAIAIEPTLGAVTNRIRIALAGDTYTIYILRPGDTAWTLLESRTAQAQTGATLRLVPGNNAIITDLVVYEPSSSQPPPEGPPKGDLIAAFPTIAATNNVDLSGAYTNYVMEFDAALDTSNLTIDLRRSGNNDNNRFVISRTGINVTRLTGGNLTFSEPLGDATHSFAIVVREGSGPAVMFDMYMLRSGGTEWEHLRQWTATGANIFAGTGIRITTATPRATVTNIAVYELAPKDALGSLIAVAEGLNQNDYMAAGWPALAPAIAAAQDVFDTAGATDAQLTDAKDALQLAIDALVPTFAVTFNPNGGRVSSTSARVNPDGVLANWPTASRDGFEFAGWFDAATGGTQYSANHVFTGPVTLFAQWQEMTFPGINKSRTAPQAFYIDSIAGSDDNPGTEALPLKSLGFINTGWVLPGDTFFLKAGSIFMGQSIRPIISGAEGLPIVIDSYGSGLKPAINPQGMAPIPNDDHPYLNNDRGMNGGYLAAIDLLNISYWEFRNLHISNFDPTLNNGIAHNTTQPTFTSSANAVPPNTNLKRLGIVVSAYNQHWDYWSQPHAGGMGSNGRPNDLTSRAGVWPLRNEINPETGKPYKDLLTFRHIYIIGCDIHDIDGNQSEKDNGGILFLLADEDVKYSHVRIEDNSLRRINRMGLQMAYNWLHEFYFHGSDTDPQPEWANGKLTEWAMGDEADYYSNDIVIRNNFFDEIGGDGIDLTMTVGALVEYNTLYRMCHTLPTSTSALGRPNDGHFSAGIWTWSSRDALFQFNEVAFIRDGGTGDKSAFDFDSQSSGYIIYQYNYTHHNAGGQLLTCSVGRELNYTIDAYYLDTRIVRYNVSAYETLSQGQSQSTTSGFFYNNVFYKSVNSTRPIHASSDPLWNISGMNANSGDSMIYSNYVFNNIFYEAERVTIDNNTSRTHSNRQFALHSLFTNNLIVDTPVRVRSSADGVSNSEDLTKEQLEGTGRLANVDRLNGNTVMTVAEFEAAGGFVGEILSGEDAKGFQNVFEVLVPETNTAAVGMGISIADVLAWVEADMIRANDEKAAAQRALDFAELDMRPFGVEAAWPTDLNMNHLVITEDIAGNLIDQAAPSIGVGVLVDQAKVDAAAFKNAHSSVLALTTVTVQISNKAAVQAAQTAFNALSAEAKDLLADEDIDAAFFTALLDRIAELESAGSGGQPGGPGGSVTPPPPTTPPVTTPTEPDETEVPDVPPLHAEEIEAEPVSEETEEAVEEAVEELAAELGAATGADVTQTGPAVVITVEDDNAIVTVVMPEDTDTSEITTMAVLGEDGSLIPVPTVIDADGNVRVLIRGAGDVVLVPLSVSIVFTDIGHLVPHMRDEINKAASMMIVRGRGGGIFAPGDSVTVQDTVTMFMRAVGLPVQWETAVAQAAAAGLISGNLSGNSVMSRIDTAVLIANVLADIGVDTELSDAEIDSLLAAFTDVGGLNAEQRAAMAICVKLGIFRGNGDGTMTPFAVLQRAHIASLTVRVQELLFGLV